MRIFERLRALRHAVSPSAADEASLPIDPLEAQFEKDHCCGGCMGHSHSSSSHGEH